MVNMVHIMIGFLCILKMVYYPCKLIACIPGEQNRFDGYHLVIQATTDKLKRGSILFHDYKFSPELRIVDAECVQGQCFVVASNIANNKVSLALDKKYWPEKFTTAFF